MSMDKIREALERGLDKSRHKECHDALEPVEVSTWWRIWALDLESNAREVLAELDKPEASDAMELAEMLNAERIKRIVDGIGKESMELGVYDSQYDSAIISSFIFASERKAREETARKCAEAAVNLIYANPECQDAEMLKISILEAAK